MKAGLADIIGKTITNVIVAENERAPKQRVFLVFSDGTYFEFWGKDFTCTGGVDRGDFVEALQYAKGLKGSDIRVYPAGE